MAKTSRSAKDVKKSGPASKPAAHGGAGGGAGGATGGGTKSAKSSKPAPRPAAKPTAPKSAPKPEAPKKPAPGTKAAQSPAKKPVTTKPTPAPPAPPAVKPVAKTDAKPSKPPPEAAKPAAPVVAAPPVTPAVPVDDKKKVPPKGITIVAKPPRAPKSKSKFQLPVSEPLIKPGAKWKPLIPSGPSAARASLLDANDGDAKGAKTKLNKRDLDRYRTILIAKRKELMGDISTMEDEALRQSSSGSLSHTPQHLADQGTDAFDQSLSLDLAQVDRNLMREIDAALARIDAGTYGVCELTGKPIKSERLEELPWARYSIEAARELERRPYQT